MATIMFNGHEFQEDVTILIDNGGQNHEFPAKLVVIDNKLTVQGDGPLAAAPSRPIDVRVNEIRNNLVFSSIMCMRDGVINCT